MTTVPVLVPPRDPAPALAWRVRRRGERDVRVVPLTTALVTDGADATTARALRAGGAEVMGLLGPEALESLAWAAEAEVTRAYGDLAALLGDAVEAVCVDLPPPASDVIALAAARAGLHVLLAYPLTSSPEALREVLDAATDRDVAGVVAVEGRAWPAAEYVSRRVGRIGRLRQLTVLDAPAGELGRVELVDLVRGWCGEILAVCAAPDAMPATELAPGARVTFALLTSSGATVQAAERAGGRLRDALWTLAGEEGRFAVSGRLVRCQDVGGIREVTLPDPPSARPGLTAAARGVLRAASPAGILPGSLEGEGATLGDLLGAARVLDAADASRRSGGWVEL